MPTGSQPMQLHFRLPFAIHAISVVHPYAGIMGPGWKALGALRMAWHAMCLLLLIMSIPRRVDTGQISVRCARADSEPDCLHPPVSRAMFLVSCDGAKFPSPSQLGAINHCAQYPR